MMGNVVHSIDHVDGHEIIRRKFTGEVTVDDVMDSFVFIINNGMIHPGCVGILTDLTDTTLSFSMEAFKNLVVFIKSSPKLSGLRIAVIVDTAEKIVFPMMASSDPGLKVQPFSTEKAALQWMTM